MQQKNSYCKKQNFTYEESQSNLVSDFGDIVCSLFPKAIIFYFYFTQCEAVIKTKQSASETDKKACSASYAGIILVIFHEILLGSIIYKPRMIHCKLIHCRIISRVFCYVCLLHKKLMSFFPVYKAFSNIKISYNMAGRSGSRCRLLSTLSILGKQFQQKTF